MVSEGDRKKNRSDSLDSQVSCGYATFFLVASILPMRVQMYYWLQEDEPVRPTDAGAGAVGMWSGTIRPGGDHTGQAVIPGSPGDEVEVNYGITSVQRLMTPRLHDFYRPFFRPHLAHAKTCSDVQALDSDLFFQRSGPEPAG